MNLGLWILLILFAIFIVLLVTNPRMSCFGRIIRSPFYPMRRKKAKKRKTEDYGFRLR
ncbi:hypothetical protein NLC26_02230 [Candidatus Aminicenantes bacterium AC-708-M15]|jgi:hypothetical protein|nr:hypothetical protein [SCandidatus Aminicenantes bacterium Aminicenantia_JdfR_composite]MCP2596888.1 hypothetical protein [Candidatus Aminicenantes bacterium AC-335-G13]MCP2604279.1 hypothetical protein [Candidatus Aminicenantes bacterium AC-708-M15]